MSYKYYKTNGAKISMVSGMVLDGDKVGFPDSFSIKDINAIRKKTAKQNRGNLVLKATTYSPNDSERSAIQSALGRDNIDGFLFVQCVAAETDMDRHRDILTKAFLEWMGEKYTEGRTIVDGHWHEQRVGKTFAAEVVEKEGGGHSLIVKFYISPNAIMRNGMKAVDQINDGLVNRVSVSFYATYTFIPESESDRGMSHYVYDRPAEDSLMAEVYELSLVTMGAQAGAKIKGQNGDIEPEITFDTKSIKPETDNMSFLSYRFKSTGQTLNIKEEDKEAAKAMDTDIQKFIDDGIKEEKEKRLEAEKKLKKFEDAEKAVRDDAVTKYVNAKKQVFGEDLKADDEKEIIKHWSVSTIEAETKKLEAVAEKLTKQIDTSNPPADEDGDDW